MRVLKQTPIALAVSLAVAESAARLGPRYNVGVRYLF